MFIIQKHSSGIFTTENFMTKSASMGNTNCAISSKNNLINEEGWLFRKVLI
jgi:hypothetical protein